MLGHDERGHRAAPDELDDARGDHGRVVAERLGAGAARRRVEPQDAGARGVGDGIPHLERLLGGLLDRAQRRVARLVDARLDRQHGGEVDRGRREHAALELAVDVGLAAREGEPPHDRPAGPAEVAREGRAGGAVRLIRRLHAAEHEIGLLRAHDGRELRRDRDRVGEEAIAGIHAQRAVGAHREAAPQRVLALVVADADQHDLAAAGGLSEHEGLLDRRRVPVVESAVEVVRIDVRAVVDELDLVAEHRDLLHAHEHPHAHRSTSVACPGRLRQIGPRR